MNSFSVGKHFFDEKKVEIKFLSNCRILGRGERWTWWNCEVILILNLWTWKKYSNSHMNTARCWSFISISFFRISGLEIKFENILLNGFRFLIAWCSFRTSVMLEVKEERSIRYLKVNIKVNQNDPVSKHRAYFINKARNTASGL